jgi:hypothetical protein
VLPDASLEDIRQACADQEYTHVPVLAHGTPFNDAGDRRFGVALCGTLDPTSADVVDGTRLAIALTARGSSGGAPSVPTFVSLATCDSGNIESVLTPAAASPTNCTCPASRGSSRPSFRCGCAPRRWPPKSSTRASSPAKTRAACCSTCASACAQRARHPRLGQHRRLCHGASFADQVRAFLYKQTRGKAEVPVGRLDTLAKGDMTSPNLATKWPSATARSAN